MKISVVGDSADRWPGRLLSTSHGHVCVREFDHGRGATPPDMGRPQPASGGNAPCGPTVWANSSRPPVLFVHGLGGESLDWVEVAMALNDAFDCYALDLPGFAYSPPPTDGDLSLDGLARAVADVARTIARTSTPVHLVGNSLGGTVAVRVAAEHPDLVASLTLVAPALPDLRPRLGSVQLLIGLVPVIGPAIVRKIIKADPEWMARRIYALCYGNPKAVTPQRHARELATLRRRAILGYSPDVYRAALRATVMSYLDRGPRRLWQQAAAVGVPTLLISGGRDRLVSKRVAARANRTFLDVQVLRLPEAGHVAHLEDPASVAAAMRAFLSRPDLIRGMSGRHGTVVEVGGSTSVPR